MSDKSGMELWKRPLAAVAAGALAFSGLVAVAGPAAAANPYNIDGNDIGNGVAGVVDPSGKAQELGPVNGSGTKLGVIHSAATPMLGTTNPNPQTDLVETWVQTASDTANTDTWLYFAWERDSNKGSGVITYEFHQDASPCDFDATQADLIAGCNPWSKRQPGDFLVVWDQQGNDIVLWLRYFADPDGGDWNDGDPLALASPGINLSTAGFAEAETSPDGFSGEAAINLTESGVFAAGECNSLGNVIPGTVTGNSDTADYKDTVLGYDLNISNCGTVKIRKVTDVATGNNQFPYTLDRHTTDKDIRYDTFTDNESASGSLDENGDYVTEANLLPGDDDYFLTEDLTGLTYDLDSIDCTPPTASDASVPSYPAGFTDSVKTDGTDNFSVEASKTTYCVIDNSLQAGTLKVKKVVNDSYGGGAASEEFSYQVTSPSGTDGDVYDGAFEAGEAFKPFPDLTAGDYTLAEKTPLPDGYEFTSIVCSNDEAGDSTANDRAVTVEPGGTTECTVTNNDLPGKLKVKKVVNDSYGGGAASEEFDYQVTSPSGTAGDVYGGTDGGAFEAAEAFKTFSGLTADDYTLKEITATLPDGYAFDSITCDNDPAQGADETNDRTVTVTNGDTTECIVTNVDSPASPTGTTVQSWILKDTMTLIGIRTGAADADEAEVDFFLYSDATCETPVGSDLDNAVESGSATTDVGVAVSAPGTYYWIADYSGDAYNLDHQTECGDEITYIQAKDEDNAFTAEP